MDQRSTKTGVSVRMGKKSNNNFDESSSEELKRSHEEIERYREKYGKRKNWPEIEEILLENVEEKVRKTYRATDYLKSAAAGQGEKDENKDTEVLLSELYERSTLKLSYYQTGMTKDDLDKYNGLIDELFTKKQIKNREYFKAFLTCDDMESIAKRAKCSKQYIQKLFHEKSIEFANSGKFIAITKDIAIRKRVIQEVKDEILAAAHEEMTLIGGSESFADEEAWNRYESNQIPDFEERAKGIEKEVGFELAGTLKDFTPGKLKEMIPCGV